MSERFDGLSPEEYVRKCWAEVGHVTSSEVWLQLAEFTASRLREIAEVEEEIEEISLSIADCQERGAILSTPIYQRILAREQALLDEKKRGLKEQEAPCL